MIFGQLLNNAVPDPVDATIAHIRNRKEVVVHRDSHNGRAHSSALLVGARGIEYLLIGKVDGATQSDGAHGSVPGVDSDDVELALLRRLSVVVQHRIHGHFAGHFTGGGPTHAVAHDIDTNP